MVEHRRVVGIDPWKLQSAWAVFWILAYSTAAAFLLKLELARFDRKLGRTPDEGMLSRSRPVVVPDANELALSLAE